MVCSETERISSSHLVCELVASSYWFFNVQFLELFALTSFVQVTKSFLENHKPNTLKNMVKNFKNSGYNMSIKVHYLHNYLDHFSENLVSYSEEQRERFHRHLKTGRELPKPIGSADYCWRIQRDYPTIPHSRKSRKRNVLCSQQYNKCCFRYNFFCCANKNLENYR